MLFSFSWKTYVHKYGSGMLWAHVVASTTSPIEERMDYLKVKTENEKISKMKILVLSDEGFALAFKILDT